MIYNSVGETQHSPGCPSVSNNNERKQEVRLLESTRSNPSNHSNDDGINSILKALSGPVSNLFDNIVLKRRAINSPRRRFKERRSCNPRLCSIEPLNLEGNISSRNYNTRLSSMNDLESISSRRIDMHKIPSIYNSNLQNSQVFVKHEHNDAFDLLHKSPGCNLSSNAKSEQDSNLLTNDEHSAFATGQNLQQFMDTLDAVHNHEKVTNDHAYYRNSCPSDAQTATSNDDNFNISAYSIVEVPITGANFKETQHPHIDNFEYTESDCEPYVKRYSDDIYPLVSIYSDFSHTHEIPIESYGYKYMYSDGIDSPHSVIGDLNDGRYTYSFEESPIFYLVYEKVNSNIPISRINSSIPELEITKSPFFIGSHRSSDLRIVNKNINISDYHCKLVCVPVSISSRYVVTNGIVAYKVKVYKIDYDAIVLINNSPVRTMAYICNGDLITLGSKGHSIDFRVKFRTSREYLSLDKQNNMLSNNSLSRGDLYHHFNSDHTTLDRSDGVEEVKVLVFEIVASDNSSKSPRPKYTVSISEISDVSIIENDTFEVNALSDRYLGEEDGCLKSPNAPVAHDDLYRLQSPCRLNKTQHVDVMQCDQSPSPSSFEQMSKLKVENVACSGKVLFDVYNTLIEGNDTKIGSEHTKTNQSLHCTDDRIEGKLEVDKLHLLKSLNSEDFPIVIDTERSCATNNESPRTERMGRCKFKYIGVVDATHNMTIENLISNVDNLLKCTYSNDILVHDKGIELFDTLIKRFSQPLEKEMLKDHWVFQLDFFDIENPKLRRAMYNNITMYKNADAYVQTETMELFKLSRCRLIYIKRK